MSKRSEPTTFEGILAIAGNHNPSKIAITSLQSANTIVAKFNEGKLDNEKDGLERALNEYLKAFWFFKDQRVDIAKTMHQIGKYLCKQYGCSCKFDGKNYYTDCPNILLHSDFGFSLRGIEKYICSICGNDPLECGHITGEMYDNIRCINLTGC